MQIWNKTKIENLFNDNLDLSSSDDETDSESDNETDSETEYDNEYLFRI